MSDITNKDKSLGQNQTEASAVAIFNGVDIPAGIFSWFMEYTSYLIICIAAFGMAGNVLILISYSKIGFSESINISYVALGISDILCITTLTWYAVCYIPAFATSNIPFIAREFSNPTGGSTSAIFIKTTAWITAFISLERCLCIVFPLRVKAIVKRNRTIVVIVTIFVLTVLPLASIVFYTYVFDFRFDAESNKTLLRVKYRKSQLSDFLTRVNYVYKLLFMNFTPFAIILVCAVVLTIHLNRSARWRLKNSSESTNTPAGGKPSSEDEKTQRKIPKEMRVVKTVLAIAITFIFTGTMSTVRYLIAMSWPEFHPVGDYAQLFGVIARLEFLLSLANSSVNFIIYYIMGTKFRSTVKQMLIGNQQKLTKTRSKDRC